jgi:GrpB-like predicted nucleotidyltransferase (UPF0157 family)
VANKAAATCEGLTRPAYSYCPKLASAAEVDRHGGTGGGDLYRVTAVTAVSSPRMFRSADLVTHDGRWSNADEDPIELRPYDPRWPDAFSEEAAALRAAIGGGLDLAIHHVGSTAIPGLSAKPIIDIIVVADRDRWPALIAPIEALGYAYWAGNPDPDRMFFVKGMPPFGAGRTHHVHVRPAEALERHLRFRDFLIAHPDDAGRYERLKRELAERFRCDRDAYTEAKTTFVEEILAKAAIEAAGR